MIRTFTVTWKAPHPAYPAVWIDTAKLEAAWPKDDDLYVDAGARTKGERHKYERFGNWLLRGIAVEMPHISFENNVVAFSEGRHRFVWLRDHGVTALPVMTYSRDTAAVRAHLGSGERVSRFIVPPGFTPQSPAR